MKFFARIKAAMRPINGADMKSAAPTGAQQLRTSPEHARVVDPGVSRSVKQHQTPPSQSEISRRAVPLRDSNHARPLQQKSLTHPVGSALEEGKLNLLTPQASEASSKLPPPTLSNMSRRVEEAERSSRVNPPSSKDIEASSNTQHQLLPPGRMVDVSRIATASTPLAQRTKSVDVKPNQQEKRAATLMGVSPAKENDDALFKLAKRLASEVDSFINDVIERFGYLRLQPPSEATLAEYSMVRQRTLKLGEFDVSRYQNSNTKQKIRAAFVWEALRHAESAMEIIRDFSRKKAPGEAITFMQSVLNVRDILAKFDAADPIGEADQNAQQRNSKRKILSKLPPDWEKTFIDAIRQDAQEWYPAACIMLAVGARPSEVRQGVIVGLCSNGNLFVKVKSAKQGSRGDRSVGVRTIEVINDSVWTQALAQAVQNCTTQELKIVSPDPKHASQLFSRLSRKCGLPANAAVVPYVLRHRFGALVKSSGLSLQDQAAAMGHGSTSALSNYGVYNNRISRGGMPVRVECERQPRVITRKSEIPRKLREMPSLDMD